MGAQGTAILDFGAFPGKSDASVAVTGQAAIGATSLVEAWIRPEATADHTADEHMLETLKVFAADIVAGTGFTIYGFNTSEFFEPLERLTGDPDRSSAENPWVGGIGTRLFGLWTIAWVWN